MDYKICVMIPITSRKTNWTSFKDTHLYNIFLKSFLLSYNNELSHLFCFAYDEGDSLFDNQDIQDEINKFISIMTNCSVKWLRTDGIPKGAVSEMWNLCFEYGYKNNYDFFLQCGDDVDFIPCVNGKWENAFIRFLESTDYQGVCGFADLGRLHKDRQDRLITQSFVHRTHYDIFKYYYPKEIKNWYVDNWITEVYARSGMAHYSNIHCIVNRGGEPRYDVEECPRLCKELVDRDNKKIINFKI